MSLDSSHPHTGADHPPNPEPGAPSAAVGPLPTERLVLFLVTAVAIAPFLALSALVTEQWYALIRFDLGMARLLYEQVASSPGLVHGIDVWTEVFGTWSMRILSVLVAVWLLLRRQFTTAVWALTAVFLANLAGLITKLGVDRPRPDFAEPLATGVGPSFPSGHALMATVGMGILLFAALPLLRGMWRGAACVLSCAIALSTALSRPLLGVHWVSDVVAGIALGVAVLAGTMLLWTCLPAVLRRWDRPVRR